MYEQFFEMTHRPFSSLPNADEFSATGPMQEALESVLNCLIHSRGVAVITGGTGTGKTAFARHIAHVFRETHRAVYPTPASLQTRKAFLQSLLYELGADYVGVEEADARLRFLEAAQEHARNGKSLLLIIDDAHELHPRLFDELRAFVDYAPQGTPLIRVLITGQFALDELLADPAQSSFNQRIGAHVCLEPMTMEQSARFLLERFRSSGIRDVSDAITPGALEMICRAAEGNVRCLCQLTDHSLLLAFAQERRPVDGDVVRDAFEDLRDLPLQWGTLPTANPSEDNSEGEPEFYSSPQLEGADQAVPIEPERGEDPALWETDEYPIPEQISNGTRESCDEEMNESDETRQNDAEVEFASIEVGADDSPLISQMAVAQEHAEKSSDPSPQPVPQLQNEATMDLGIQEIVEEPVLDRYAALDRRAELPEEKWGSVSLPDPERPIPSPSTRHEAPVPENIEEQLLQDVQETLAEVTQFKESKMGPIPVTEVVQAKKDADQENPETSGEDRPNRRYELLFTRLRNHRRKLSEK